MTEIEVFKGFLEKIATLPLNPAASKPRPASATTTIPPPPAPPTSFTVTLKPMRGDAKTLKMALDASVSQLRAKAAEAFAIEDVARCRLIRSGRALQDDSVTLSAAFGMGAAEVTLHLLEKPKEVAAAAKISLSEACWSRIERVLEEEGVGVADRKLVIEKFQTSLK